MSYTQIDVQPFIYSHKNWELLLCSFVLAIFCKYYKLNIECLYFQINFFQDHTKVILCPLMGAVTYIDEKREVRTFRMPLIEKYGCCRELASRLRYARTMVERLITSKSGSSRAKSAASVS